MINSIQNTPIITNQGMVQARKNNNNEQVIKPAFGSGKQVDVFWINKLIDSLVDKLPEKTIKENGLLAKAFNACKNFTSPHQRLILGATAIAIQPEIDKNNKDVDEQTREVSAARTAAKAIAGTVTGVPIRALCIKAIEKVTDPKGTSKFSQSFIPNKLAGKAITPEAFEKAFRLVRSHRNSLGTCAALVVMLFTNFLLDVPITKYLTNVFVERNKAKKQAKLEAKGGIQ